HGVLEAAKERLVRLALVVHLHGRDAQALLVDLGRIGGVRAGHAASHVGLVADGRREGEALALEEDRLQHEDVGDVHAAFERIVEAVDVARLHAVAVACDRGGQGVGERGEVCGERQPLSDRAATAVAERGGVIHVVAQDPGVRRAQDGQRHLVGDRQQRVAEQLERDRISHGFRHTTPPSGDSSMTMLPWASSAARAPGGTTQVASYSSTIHGPSLSVARLARSGRSMIGVSRHPSSGPKYTRRAPPARPGPERSTRSASGTRGRSGMPRPTTRKLTISTGSSGPARCPYVRSCSRPNASSISSSVPATTAPLATGTLSSNDWPS